MISSNRNSQLCLIPLSQFVESQFNSIYTCICTVVIYTTQKSALSIYYIYNLTTNGSFYWMMSPPYYNYIMYHYHNYMYIYINTASVHQSSAHQHHHSYV